jgi:hypothetical protein
VVQRIAGSTPAGIKAFAERRKDAPAPPPPLPAKAPPDAKLHAVNEPGASEHPIWVVKPRKPYDPGRPVGTAVPPLVRQPRRTKPRTFKAKFEGACGNCHQPIKIGTLITATKSHGYFHSGGCPKKR